MNEEVNEIFIPPDNRMKASYQVIGADNSDISLEIDVRAVNNSNTNSSIYIRAIESNKKDTEIFIMYRNNNDILVEIQPVVYGDVFADIEVRPNNRMWALFEIQEPPKITSSQKPTKDAFTRSQTEYQYINHGINNTLAVGEYRGEKYETYMHFDMSNWHPQHMVLNSTIRLYYSGIIPKGTILELYTVDKEWNEYGLTYMNKPDHSVLIVDEYVNNEDVGYVEFAITETVMAWINRPDLNHGFVIKASNGTNNGAINFRSRESYSPPELLITYYDARILSPGRSQTYAELFVWSVGEEDVLAEIEVASVYGYSDVSTEIYIHRVEVPVESNVNAELIVTRLRSDSEITISLQDDDNIPSEISARSPILSNILDTEIVISKSYQYADLFVKYENIVDSEITIVRDEDIDVLTEISSTRDNVEMDIYVKYQDSVISEVTVQRDNINELASEITVTRDNVEMDIYVKYQDSVISEVTVQRDNINELASEITVTRDNVEMDIYVKYQDSVLAEITAQSNDFSEIPTEITASQRLVSSEINIRTLDDDEVDSDIYIRVGVDNDLDAEVIASRNSVKTEITVTYYTDMLSEIFVKYTNDKIITFNVGRPKILTDIVVPYWDNNDTPMEVRVRAYTVDQINTEITVGGNGYAYVFII